MTQRPPSSVAFWQLFVSLVQRDPSGGLVEQNYDALLSQLQAFNPGVFIELGVGGEENELTVTADGDSSLFPLVREIVEQAPSVEGWRLHALKPKRGFPDTVKWQTFELATSEVVFDPLERNGSRDLGLRIFVPGLKSEDTEDAHNAILRAIDAGLGEEKFAQTVTYTEVRPMPDGAAASDYIPLVDLERFIDWRKQN